jgi:tRNA uridine 5-carboxymethylaminomethyl modification enzyme
LAGVENLTLLEGEVTGLELEQNQVRGVRLADGERLACRAVIVTSGTFLRAVMHTGFDQAEGGRAGDRAAKDLSNALKSLGFDLARLKTGTPPRLHKNSIDFSRLEEQPGDAAPIPFSFYGVPQPFPHLRQISCHLTYTNEQTHEIIEKNFNQSPLFTGVIQGVGPRYCPSIEDKVKRFREKERHQLFLEPEGLDVDEIYINGISTSLPQSVQDQFVRSIDGLESSTFIRYGYAVEYDAVDPRALRATLESKDVEGLYFAGQVNGTSGYEEAGAQGLIAGINAAAKILERGDFVLSRTEAYIGVMIDDLVTHGVDEPYRMFTSRAEHRLYLREDNADLRLSPRGRSVGLLDEASWERFETKQAAVARGRAELQQKFVLPTEETNAWMRNRGLRELKDRVSAEGMLRRPEISHSELDELSVGTSEQDARVREQIEVQVKYEGYIQREMELLEFVRKNESIRIPGALDFEKVSGLSHEIRARLRQTRPESLGQAARMQGMTPAAVANLFIHLKSHVSGI